MELIEVYTDVEIRKLAELASEIWHEYWTCILSVAQINYMVEKFQSYNAIKSQLKNDNYLYYFLKENGKVIGYSGISKKDNYLFLSKLYIKKKFRHLGYGQKVFKLIVTVAKNFGYKSIRLTVNKNNINTINAYLKYGFKTIDSVVTDIGSGFVMDDYIMEYVITGF